MAEPAVAVEGISKNYGSVQALYDVNFHADVGEIHGLVGENGAGKSTLMKILSGTTVPATGKIQVFGTPVTLHSPFQSQSAGIHTVFQELTLVPDLTVADNVLNLQPGSNLFHRTSSRKLQTRVAQIFEELGVANIDPAAYIRELSLPDRQMVEIVKAVSHHPKILILDEATSALLATQVTWLFEMVRKLKDAGATVLFSSHRWDEIKNLTETMTVFRNGRLVGRYSTSDISENEATTLMTGRRIEALYPLKPPPQETVVLSIQNLRSAVLKNLSFNLHAGEILGIGGLQGQGQRELFLSLFGALPATGKISIEGNPVTIRSPQDAIRHRLGIGLVPEDRKTEGLFLSLGTLENVTIPSLASVSRGGFIQRWRQRQLFAEATERLQIKLSHAQQSVNELSGGNQQKVVLAKWLAAKSRILLLYDVTRGVDVGTKHDIYELMAELSAAGLAILFYSSETAEVVHMAHRVLVLYEGSIQEELSGDRLTLERVVGASLRSRVVAQHG